MPRVRTALWYLRRPVLLPQLVRTVRSRLIGKSAQTTDPMVNEATSWCQERAVDAPTALRMLGGSESPSPVRDAFPEVFAAADEAAAEVPLRMGGAASLDLLYWSCELVQASRAIETGVAYGWSSLALLLSLRRRHGTLVSIDMPYVGHDNDRYVGAVVPEGLREGWTLLRRADREGLPRAIKLQQPIDICHYDSDKSYEGRCWSYPRLWTALRPGGLLISDDIGDNFAFRDFTAAHSLDPIVVRIPEGGTDKFAGILRKPDPSSQTATGR